MAGLFDKYTKPLCPLDRDFDVSRSYLAFKGTEKPARDFARLFGDPASWVRQGQVVVVAGDRGCGKTSFIQRSAADMVRNATADGHCRVIPVDLSDEGWSPQELQDDRMSLTLDAVLDKLGTLVTTDEHLEIGRHESPERKFWKLGQILSKRRPGHPGGPPVGVVVLLEGYPQPEEVAAYYRISGKGLLFFAEMFEERNVRAARELIANSQRRHARHCTLELGTLKSDDPGLFLRWVEQVRDEALRAGRTWPEISPGIEEFFKRLVVSDEVCTAEMVKAFWGALDIALDQGATVLTTDHIALHYRNPDGRV